jgi:hypothetical protein
MGCSMRNLEEGRFVGYVEVEMLVRVATDKTRTFRNSKRRGAARKFSPRLAPRDLHTDQRMRAWHTGVLTKSLPD